MGPIEKKYRDRTPKSAEISERAAAVIPGGEVRSSIYHPPYSIVVDHAEGARLYDIDGNEYIDLNNNFTCLVHGHVYPPLIEAVNAAVQKGTSWTAKAMSQIELAELLVERVASVDEVRFANSGAEAVQHALILARGYTRRTKILVSNYSYHGSFLDTSGFVSRLTDGNGKPLTFVDTFIGEYNNAESFEAILAEHGHEIAAVILEPWLAAGGYVAGEKAFFERVQAATRDAGALFVFDEATVFRTSTGGAQELLGLMPDLTVLGKIIGGGFPVGGVGGKREIMELSNPATGIVNISGTFSGNPITTTAGYVAVRDLTEDKIQRMSRQMAQIEGGVRASCAKHGIPFSSRRLGSLATFWFQDELPASILVRTDLEIADNFHLACMANGIFGSRRTQVNTSSVTSDDDVAEIIERFEAAVADVAAAI